MIETSTLLYETKTKRGIDICKVRRRGKIYKYKESVTSPQKWVSFVLSGSDTSQEGFGF